MTIVDASNQTISMIMSGLSSGFPDESLGFVQENKEAILVATLVIPILIEIGTQFSGPIRRKIEAIRHPIDQLPFETSSERRKRIRHWVIRGGIPVAVLVTIGTSLIALQSMGVLPPTLREAGKISDKVILKAQKIIRARSDAVVFGGYTTLGATHSIQAYRAKGTGNRLRVISHLWSIAVAFSAIAVMATDRQATRWHHLGLGLLMLIPDLRALHFTGHCLVADGMLYWAEPSRPGDDFSDIMKDYLFLYLLQLIVLCSWQITSSYLEDDPGQEESMEGTHLLGGRELTWSPV